MLDADYLEALEAQIRRVKASRKRKKRLSLLLPFDLINKALEAILNGIFG